MHAIALPARKNAAKAKTVRGLPWSFVIAVPSWSRDWLGRGRRCSNHDDSPVARWIDVQYAARDRSFLARAAAVTVEREGLDCNPAVKPLSRVEQTGSYLLGCDPSNFIRSSSLPARTTRKSR
jgi:hypothetical protein